MGASCLFCIAYVWNCILSQERPTLTSKTTNLVLHSHTALNQARAWFFEIVFVLDVGMCARPQGHKLHSRDNKSVQPVERNKQ